MKYRLQEKIESSWVDRSIVVNGLSEVEKFIGNERVDYEWRAGYMFKPWEINVCRFVIDSGQRKGSPL